MGAQTVHQAKTIQLIRGLHRMDTVGGGVGESVEPALQRGGRRLGIVAGRGDALVAQEALQVGDVHAEREQARRHRMAEQVRIDALGDPGDLGHGADDLADALAGQCVRHGAGPLLAAGEQRPGPAGADVQPQELGQVAPDGVTSRFA